MTYYEAIRAGQALNKLAGVPLPYQTARQVQRWQAYCAKALHEAEGRDAEICQRLGGKVEGADVRFADGEAAAQYRSEREWLLRQEPPGVLPAKLDLRETLPTLRISADALSALAPVARMEDDAETA